MPLNLKPKPKSEVIKLFDANDQFIDILNFPLMDSDGEPRTVRYKGKLYREGGRPDSFYGPGEFAEVPSE